MFQFKHIVFVSILLFSLTACGGSSSNVESASNNTESSSSDRSMDLKQSSIEKISNYANNLDDEPTKEDYINAGADSTVLTYVNLDELNALVANKESSEVDSTEELVALIETIVDKTAPVITLKGNMSLSLLLGESYVEAGATAVDSKDGSVNVTVDNSAVNISKEGGYKVIYTASDNVSNTATLERTVMVRADTIAPIITLNGSNSITLALGETYIESGATATDNEDDTVSVRIDSSAVNIASSGTYNVRYTATDAAGNQATLNRTVNVLSDLIPPVITVTTEATVKETESFTPSATALDNVDGNVNVVITSSVDTSTVGTYNVVYVATDSQGNEARKEVSVEVTALSISELFEKSKSGQIDDVTYIVVGDSTRSHGGYNTVLINTRNSNEGYYKDLLTPKNIAFDHTARASQRVDYWLGDTNRDIGSNAGDEGKFLISDTLNKIAQVNAEHCIVEFSMGINDALKGRIDDVKADIIASVKALEATGVHVLLVSPAPYYLYKENSYTLNSIYEEIQSEDELDLPFISGFDYLDQEYPNNINPNLNDNIHPSETASKGLADYIFEQIESDSL